MTDSGYEEGKWTGLLTRGISSSLTGMPLALLSIVSRPASVGH